MILKNRSDFCAGVGWWHSCR